MQSSKFDQNDGDEELIPWFDLINSFVKEPSVFASQERPWFKFPGLSQAVEEHDWRKALLLSRDNCAYYDQFQDSSQSFSLTYNRFFANHYLVRLEAFLHDWESAETDSLKLAKLHEDEFVLQSLYGIIRGVVLIHFERYEDADSLCKQVLDTKSAIFEEAPQKELLLIIRAYSLWMKGNSAESKDILTLVSNLMVPFQEMPEVASIQVVRMAYLYLSSVVNNESTEDSINNLYSCISIHNKLLHSGSASGHIDLAWMLKNVICKLKEIYLSMGNYYELEQIHAMQQKVEKFWNWEMN